jgi:hypothetical protein
MHQHRHIQHYCNASPLLSFLLPSSHHHRITIATLLTSFMLRNANSPESITFPSFSHRHRHTRSRVVTISQYHPTILPSRTAIAPLSHLSHRPTILPSCSYPSPCQQPSPPSSTSSSHFISSLPHASPSSCNSLTQSSPYDPRFTHQHRHIQYHYNASSFRSSPYLLLAQSSPCTTACKAALPSSSPYRLSRIASPP